MRLRSHPSKLISLDLHVKVIMSFWNLPPESTVCIVIPVFNEREQLEASIRKLLDAALVWGGIKKRGQRKADSGIGNEREALKFEILVADNGSTDGTTEIAERLAMTLQHVRHVRLTEKGRGRALRQAWTTSDAEILTYMDVDLSTDLSSFPALVELLASGAADLAVGSRLLRPEWTKRGWKREFVSRGYNRLLRSLFRGKTDSTRKDAKFSRRGLSFSDAQCGFKAITKKAANELLPLVEDNEWFFDTELLLLADFFEYRIHDLPVRWTDDLDSRVKIIPTIIQDLKGILRMKRKFRSMAREAWRREQRNGIEGEEVSLSIEL